MPNITKLTIFFLLFYFTTFSSNNKIEDLQQQLSVAHDSVKYEIIEDIADELYYAGKLAESAEQYRQAKTFEEGRSNPDLNKIARSLSNEAFCYLEIGYFKRAIDLFDEALGDYSQLNNQEEQAIQNSNIGHCWFNLGNHQKSIEYYQKALDIDRQRNDTNGMGVSYSVMANVFSEWRKYDKTIEFLHKSLEIAEEVGNKRQISTRMGKLAATFSHVQQYDSALFYFEKSLPIVRSLNDKNRIVIRLTQIGDAYYQLKQYNKADQYFSDAIGLLEDIENLKTKAILFSDYGFNCVELDQEGKGVSFLQKGIEISEQINLNYNLQRSYAYLAEFYYRQKAYKNAYEYSLKFHTLKDSAFTQNSQKQLAEFEVLFETQQKEATIKDLEQQQQLKNLQLKNANSRRNFAILIALVAVTALLGSIIISRQLKSKNTELANLNNTLKRMFSIISHDLRSSIASFQSAGRVMNYHLDKEEFEKLEKPANEVNTRSQQLTVMLDNLLNWSMSQIKHKQTQPIETNIYQIAKTEIEFFASTAKTKNIEFINKVPQSTFAVVDVQHFNIVLRNLMANAVKFTENGSITLFAETRNEEIVFSISDTGIGMDEKIMDHLFEITNAKIRRGTKNEKGTGLGLNLVKEFVELNNGKINVESEPNKGTKFTLYLSPN